MANASLVDLSAENITHYENTRRNPRKTLINACAEDSAAVLQAAGNVSLTTGTSGKPRPVTLSSFVFVAHDYAISFSGIHS